MLSRRISEAPASRERAPAEPARSFKIWELSSLGASDAL
jgi:hypothetical protein